MRAWLMSLLGYVAKRRSETKPAEKDRREREHTLMAVEGTQDRLRERLDRLDRIQRAEFELLTQRRHMSEPGR
jgi:hypothetical protein